MNTIETPATQASQSPVITQKQVPQVRRKIIMKVTQKPEILQKEMKMILALRKIRPAARPIQLNLDRKLKKKAAKPQVSDVQSKRSLIVSIPLAKMEENVSKTDAYFPNQCAVSVPQIQSQDTYPSIQPHQPEASQPQDQTQVVNQLLQELIQQQIGSIMSQIPEL